PAAGPRVPLARIAGPLGAECSGGGWAPTPRSGCWAVARVVASGWGSRSWLAIDVLLARCCAVRSAPAAEGNCPAHLPMQTLCHHRAAGTVPAQVPGTSRRPFGPSRGGRREDRPEIRPLSEPARSERSHPPGGERRSSTMRHKALAAIGALAILLMLAAGCS